MSWLRSPVLVWMCATVLAGCGGTPVPGDDAGSDAAHDAAPACRNDSDCDDGLYCNGTEHCAMGQCASGSATICTDSVACTVDSCNEAMRGCVFRVPDADGDGAGAASCVDGTGTALGTDCDDTDANRYPGNREVCDATGHDEDCDPTTHGGVDADGDGFEDARCCNGTACGDDCDDGHPSAHPGATEVCNLVDDNCDGHVDEGVATTGFVDADRDGFGDPTMPLSACTTAAGFSASGTDCDDASAARNPAQPEFCDGLDNDCDASVDEDASAVTWYRDVDGDGFGSAASGTLSACAPPTGYALRGTDCNDASAAVSPAAAELCNAIDDDCNGVADYVIASGDLEDDDHDGIADASCGAPLGVDCDDRDASSGPGTLESCDGRDNDCDTIVDEGATEVAFYRDADGDGFGDSRSVRVGCTQPIGFARQGGDCDDGVATRFPGEHELCNAIDDDCDGATDEGEASSSCTLAGSSMACVAGACVLVACEPGYGDCSSSAPGCETNVSADPDHCGTCVACAAPISACSAGTCRPLLAGPAAIETDVGDVVVERVLSVPGSNDTILAGRFTGTLTFGGTVLTSAGDYDGFVARLRPDGSPMYAFSWGAAGFDAIHAVAMTPDGGAMVVGGEMCNGTLCGGPLFGCYGFWQRFGDAATPGCTYASGLSATTASIRALAIEQTGGQTYVYAAGSWTGSAPFGLGISTGNDAFVLRARELPSSNPTIEWARAFTGSFDEIAEDIALDGASNLVVVGYTSGSADFGYGLQGHAGYDDAYVVNVDRATGTIGVATQFGTSTGDDHAHRLLALPGGQVAITGYFASGTIRWGVTPLTATGPHNLFLVRGVAGTLSTTWSTVIEGNVDPGALAIAGGRLILSGAFSGSLGLTRGTLTSAGQSAFVTSLGLADGSVGFARATQGGLSDRSGGTATRADGSLAWEVEHDGFVGIGGGLLTSGVDQDVAMVLVTP